MSLIQQALDKTSRANKTRTANAAPVSKTYARDPMGAVLDRELSLVQRKYAYRRSLYWKIALGVLSVCFVSGLAFIGIRSKNVSPKTVEAGIMPQVPVKIFGGYIYRLTGISKSGDKSSAVINNRVVGVGDKLNNKAVVMAIGEGGVRLDVQGKEINLTL